MEIPRNAAKWKKQIRNFYKTQSFSKKLKMHIFSSNIYVYININIKKSITEIRKSLWNSKKFQKILDTLDNIKKQNFEATCMRNLEELWKILRNHQEPFWTLNKLEEPWRTLRNFEEAWGTMKNPQEPLGAFGNSQEPLEIRRNPREALEIRRNP